MDEITGHWNANFLSFSRHSRLPFGIWYFSGRCTEYIYVVYRYTVYVHVTNTSLKFEHDKIFKTNTCIGYNARKTHHEMSGTGIGEREHRTPSVRFPFPLSRFHSFAHCQVNKPFFSPVQCSCSPHSPFWVMLCTCVSWWYFHPIFLLSVLSFSLFDSISLNLSPSGCSTLCVFFCQTSISKTFISLATLPFDCIPLWNFEDFCQYTKMSLKFDWIGVRAQWITQNKKRQHVIEMMSAKYKRVITTTVRTSTLNKIIRNKNRDKIYLAPIIYCLSLFNIPLPHLAFLCERTANSIRSDFKGFEFRCINYPSLMPKF